MGREIFALLLMVLLIAVSVWNIHAVDKLTTDIEARIETAENAALSGDNALAELEFQKALKLWLDAEGYTHVFIRHPEIDSCTDAFYEALEALGPGDSREIQPRFELLRYHLESIASMERISLGNIF